MTRTAEKPPTPEALRQGYEPPDVGNRGLLIFFVIFLATAVVVNLGLWGLLKIYISEPRSVNVKISAAPAQKRFPQPDLQPVQSHNQLPWQDLQDLKREKADLFRQLGWNVNPSTGVPSIPDDIVNQLAQRRNSNGGGK
jgi:hypothetical protein